MSLRRLAASLGLSPSAVSLALRSSPKIPAPTRARVLAAADRAGYRPNAKLHELMSQLRQSGAPHAEGCFGVISFYDSPTPWDRSRHLRLIYDSMTARAGQLGYRLEPLWLRAPGMTLRRFRGILDARGIQGLLCFGSPELTRTFPAELDHYAVITVGLSIATPLHRVTSHFYSDLARALQKLHDLGYRRPGLVLGKYEDDRSAHAYTSAYYGWCDQAFGAPTVLPVLRIDRLEEAPLLRWQRQHRPDVIVFVHLYDMLDDLRDVLRRNRVRVPEDLGVVAVSQILEGTEFSGMQQNQQLMGAWAVESLVSRIHSGDFGIPENPRIEMVESRWVPGRTLRAAPRSALDAAVGEPLVAVA